MSQPDFSKYTLALFSNDAFIASSTEARLKPLIHMVQDHRGKVNCEIHDKIVGLASAKVIFASGMVSIIKAHIMSLAARDFLEKTSIQFTYQELVDGIMNQDKTGPCPMEVKAREIARPDEFLEAMIDLIGRAD